MNFFDQQILDGIILYLYIEMFFFFFCRVAFFLISIICLKLWLNNNNYVRTFAACNGFYQSILQVGFQPHEN